MDTKEEYTVSHEGFRPFDPSKVPASPELRGLIDEAEELAGHQEPRTRRRRPADQQVYREALSALVCDLIHCHLESPGTWVTVEFSKKDLGAKARRAPFMTEAFPTLVRCLAEAGVAEVAVGYRTQFGNVRTKVRASEFLARRVDVLGIGYSDVGRNIALQGDPLILRVGSGKAKRTVPLPKDDRVPRLRAEMLEINAWLAEAPITWEGDEDVDTGRRFLHRIFNQGSLERGGRLYFGYWQDVSSEDRLAYIRIGGSPVVSLDFAQMAVHLAYAKVGATPPDSDLYAHPWFPREGVKRVLTAMLAASAPFRRMPQGCRQYFRKGVSVDDVVSELARRHYPLAPLFFRDNSLDLMNLESQIVVKALLSLKARGVVALPVHDCVLVAEGALQAAREELGKASKEVVGTDIPVVVSTMAHSTNTYPG